MEISFVSPLIAALSTLIIGSIWYNPKIFGSIWMRETGLNEAELQKGNMFVLFGLTFVFAYFIGLVMQMVVIHQLGAIGMVGGPAKLAEAKPSFTAFMADYGTAFRTYKHGALHGFMTGVFLAFPMIAINALFERKSWSYIFVHAGYWIACLTAIGAIVCGWV
jgi:Protein of unknown function (DUF1761)